jgi:hypothetical protein
MTRRRTRYATLSLALAVCGIGIGVLYWNGTAAEHACGRLHLGMTRWEVEDVLGEPADNLEMAEAFGKSTYGVQSNGCEIILIGRSDRMFVWTWPDDTLVVAYDESMRVSGYHLCNHRIPLWERLRLLVGW